MTQIFGVIRPTSIYPRLRYGSPAVTLDFLEGVAEWLPSSQGLRGANLVASGEIEYLYGRLEEAVSLTVVCLPSQYSQLRRAMEQQLVAGLQFDAWVDRFTGSCWMFAEHLADQNGLELALNSGSASYVDIGETHGRGLSLGASQRLSVAIAQASATPTKTGFDDPISKAQGVLLVDFRPTWASTDGAQRYLVDTSGTTSNRLRLYKTTGNVMRFEILDASAGSKIVSGSPTWAANDRVEIMARWTPAGALQLWYAVNEGPFVELTSASGAGTGILGALGTNLYLGSENDGTDFAPGVYQGFIVYTHAFDRPQVGLRAWRPVWRNYFPYAELTGTGWQPSRVSLDPMIWSYPIVLRAGVVHAS
jgi:hypothetical protein